MKEFKLKKILLLSLKEGKAKKVIFNNKITVILGRNSTGKSCLIKSIYQTFGAEPQNIHPNWKDANAISLVFFTIDGLNYSILRNGRVYVIFNSNGEKTHQFSKVSEMADYFALLFDFKIKLTNREGEIVTPPPAYLFLPYYADQDKSWISNWSSFSKLYLPDAKTDIVNYHTGIRPNEFYEAKNELGFVNDGIAEIDKEMGIVKNLLKNLKDKLSQVDFSLNINDFQEEVKGLLVSCEGLNKLQNKLKQELSTLYNQKINIEAQLKITQMALHETNKDYDFAVNNLDVSVSCPSCGAEYENNFSERFGIAQDEQRCLDLIVELKDELLIINNKIELINNRFTSNNIEIADIKKRLEQKKENIKLKDVIESEGKREMKKLFESEIQMYETELKEKLLSKSQLEKEVKRFEDKKRASEIRESYRTYMLSFLKKLNVYSLSESSYKSIDSSIKESGSAMPRALMAYYYSILYVIKNYGTSAFCPIIIDSPNQQGQDSENLPRLINFILEKQPEDSQLILGLEELPENDLDLDIVELTEKRSLLQADEYDEVFAEIKPFLNEIIE